VIASIVVFLIVILFWSFNSKSCDGSPKILVEEKRVYVLNGTTLNITVPEYHSSYAKLTHILTKIFEVEYRCNKIQPLPGDNENDGTWRICDDHKPVLPCTEYSFGIAGDFNFEDAYRKHTGCDVFTFDPSMGQEDHLHAPGVQFFNLGISAEKNDNYPGREYGGKGKAQAWKVDTVANIMKKLNHTKGSLLKIDTEGAEWDSLLKCMEDGTLLKWDQLLFEIHLWGFSPQTVDQVIGKWYKFFNILREKNFQLFNSHVNPYSPSIRFPNHYFVPCCFELSFINVNNVPQKS